jgi:hypothetical protein
MSDPVLAAIITATATICMSLLQLRFSLTKDGSARVASQGGRRKGGGRHPYAILCIIIVAAMGGGFALSQWMNEGERAAQSLREHELQTRVDEISRTADQLEQIRSGARAEIEQGILRKIGSDGVVVMATVSPCRPSLVVGSSGSSSPPGVSAETTQPPAPICSESEASSVKLCATIPADAKITEVELYTKLADSDSPWSTSRVLGGQENGQSRFAEKFVDGPESPGTRQVCQGFTYWSTEHARVARVVVRYGI